jgi:hypothetical protein
MEIVNEYERLCDYIWKLARQFYVNYNIKPNIVNVGRDEFYNLKNGNRFLLENGSKNDSNYTIFGMKLKCVDEKSYLAVGLVIE